MAMTERTLKPGRVAVVGAGLAGLACAEALQASGATVTVFDKSRGPSGRMSTRRGDTWQCDHGAQYFTARDAAFRAEVGRWVGPAWPRRGSRGWRCSARGRCLKRASRPSALSALPA